MPIRAIAPALALWLGYTLSTRVSVVAFVGFALPAVFSGLRIAATFSVVGAAGPA